MQIVLFDTNIILDIALKRLPHFNDAAQLFTLMNISEYSVQHNPGYIVQSISGYSVQ